MTAKHDIRKAREVVADYLIAYVGEKAVAGTPHFDAERKVWSVPVLCYTPRGIFLGGKMELDERPEIIYAPSKSEFTRVVVAFERGEGDTILDVEKYWGDATVRDIHEQIMAAKANGEVGILMGASAQIEIGRQYQKGYGAAGLAELALEMKDWEDEQVWPEPCAAVDKNRLNTFIAHLDDPTMQQVCEALAKAVNCRVRDNH